MLKKLHLLILFLMFSKSHPLTLIDSASSIANSEFNHRITTTVMWQQAETTAVTELLATYHGSVQTVDFNTWPEHETISFEQAVLFITAPGEFQHFVTKLDRFVLQPSKVLVTCFNDSTDLNIITKTAWENDITDIIIMLQDLNNTEGTVRVYTYFPYTEDSICENTDPVKLDANGNVFPRKFKNFHGCPLKVSSTSIGPYSLRLADREMASSLGGIWGDIFSLVVENLNANLNVAWIKLLVQYKDKKWTGVIKHVIDKESDVYGPILADHRMDISVLMTPIHYFYEIVWCGPSPREIYAWAKVIVPLFSNITVIFCCSLVAFVFNLKMIHKFEPGKGKKKHPRIFWQAIAILLGQQADYVFKSTLMNILFAIWIWACLVISIAYQGELVRGLQTSILEPRFRTLENAVKSVDAYAGSATMRGYYNGTPFADNFMVIEIPTLVASIPEVARGKRWLLITDKLVMAGYKNLQFLDDAVRYIPMTSVARPRWGAFPEISIRVLRVVESGFFQKRLTDYLAEVRKKDRMNEPTLEGWVRLDFVTLSTCFYGLVLMWLLCIIIFCMEYYYERFTTPTFRSTLKSSVKDQ